jgi:hypothetical protein
MLPSLCASMASIPSVSCFRASADAAGGPRQAVLVREAIQNWLA